MFYIVNELSNIIQDTDILPMASSLLKISSSLTLIVTAAVVGHQNLRRVPQCIAPNLPFLLQNKRVGFSCIRI
jgi:hypothetical protein